MSAGAGHLCQCIEVLPDALWVEVLNFVHSSFVLVEGGVIGGTGVRWHGGTSFEGTVVRGHGGTRLLLPVGLLLLFIQFFL